MERTSQTNLWIITNLDHYIPVEFILPKGILGQNLIRSSSNFFVKILPKEFKFQVTWGKGCSIGH